MATGYTNNDLEQARAKLEGLMEWYERHGGVSRTKARNDVKSARLWVSIVEDAIRASGKTAPTEGA